MIFLQKASDAKRSYGTILSVKSMQYGEHEEHVSHHTSDHLKSLLLKSYEEANVDPATVDFVEAYGSGIKVIRVTKFKLWRLEILLFFFCSFKTFCTTE